MLGLRVKSDLPDPATVLLTVAQNRFLLNALRGEGFLNMRLTDAEAEEVIGIDPVRRVFEQCVASSPCLASAISLARTLSQSWRAVPFRDADFIRHEAAMSMLQYRHKSRAWKAMITTDGQGVTRAIKDQIAQGIEEAATPDASMDGDLDTLMDRVRQIRDRLAPRIPGMPDDATLRGHLRGLKAETLRALLISGAWDTLIMGGEEVDIDIFYRQDPPDVLVSKNPRGPAAETGEGEGQQLTRVIRRGPA